MIAECTSEDALVAILDEVQRCGIDCTKYNPKIHPKQNKPWNTKDQRFLIEKYEVLGPEKLSLALGRTIHTVTTRACSLRREGLMPKPSTKHYHKRLSGGQQHQTQLVCAAAR